MVATLKTSGHTVLISGSTLCLCFLGMLLIPVSTISTMGVAAAATVRTNIYRSRSLYIIYIDIHRYIISIASVLLACCWFQSRPFRRWASLPPPPWELINIHAYTYIIYIYIYILDTLCLFLARRYVSVSLGMLLIPVSTISAMGVAAAATVRTIYI